MHEQILTTVVCSISSEEVLGGQLVLLYIKERVNSRSVVTKHCCETPIKRGAKPIPEADFTQVFRRMWTEQSADDCLFVWLPFSKAQWEPWKELMTLHSLFLCTWSHRGSCEDKSLSGLGFPCLGPILPGKCRDAKEELFYSLWWPSACWCSWIFCFQLYFVAVIYYTVLFELSSAIL